MFDKNDYQNIAIPDELDDIVNNAILDGISTKKKNRGLSIIKRIEVAAAVFVVCMIALLNTSSTFAQAASDIPIIGDLCRIITFREYHFEDNIKYIDVKIPKIENTGKSELEQRVNLEVQKKISDCIKQNEEVAKEYYEAYIGTGGDPEEFIPIGITVDYEIKCINDRYISFTISQYETAFNAYNHEFFYNIDLGTGRIITLKDWYGNNYKQVVAESIENTIAGWSEEQKENLWENISFTDLISENTDFYINQDGHVVVAFTRYKVACGAAGTVEFVIETEGNDSGF